MNEGRPWSVVALAAVLFATLASTPLARAEAPAWLDVRGDLALTGTVQRTAAEALPQARVDRPLTLSLRLDARAALGDRAALVAVLAPTAAFGRPDTPAGEPLATIGLQDAYLALTPRRDLELTIGAQRWPLGELRLAPTLRLEPTDRFGVARGLAGARATVYLHPWRLRVGATAPLDDDLRPGDLGGVASLRWDVASWTLEASAFATARPGGGLSASGTVDPIVLTGDVWLLGDPFEARGGVGASGYVGDVLVTGEAAWTPEGGALTGEPRPVVRLSGQATPVRDVALDLTVGVAWPEDAAEPERRTTVVDARAVLSFDRPEAVLSVAPTVRHGAGVTTVGASLTLRTFF